MPETFIKIECCHCGKTCKKRLALYNRAKKDRAKLFCGQRCFGLSRRTGRSKEQEKFIKYFYDAFIRLVDYEKVKKQRQEYFKKDYAANPEKYRAIRKKRMKEHVEYCRRPEYRVKKKVYDRQRVAKKNYGEYWEAAISLRELADIVDNRQAKQEQKTINKTQNRKRYANKNTKRKELESCVMGLYQPS